MCLVKFCFLSETGDQLTQPSSFPSDSLQNLESVGSGAPRLGCNSLKQCSLLVDSASNEYFGDNDSCIADIRRWVVMEAPTGQRFCAVRPQRANFDLTANHWD